MSKVTVGDRWFDYEEFLVQKEYLKILEKRTLKELEKFYIENDNQFFLGVLDFIKKNKV